MAVDTSGNIYIADTYNDRIRKATASTGIITTVAGNGTPGYSGDGGAATSTELFDPEGVAVDKSGNIYIADTYNDRIRKVTASTGIITTVAGNGTQGYSGDGGAAVNAELYAPIGVAVDATGNIYDGEAGDERVRKVAVSTGIITTVAGNGTEGYSGDGGAAVSAELYDPSGVAVDATDNIYVADMGNNRIRAVGFAKTTPSISVSCSPNPITYGSETSTCTISVGDGATGTIALYYNGTDWTTLTLSDGSALATGLNDLPAGSYSVVANYSGDSNNNATSGSTTLTISKATPTVSVFCSPNPITYGGAGSICTVSASDTGTVTGTVSLTYNGTAWATHTISSGSTTAAWSSTFGIGTYTIGATYNGDSNNNTASGSGSVTVNQTLQTISFAAPASPVAYGVAPIALSATGGASGNAVVFSIVSGPGSISGNTLTITGVGTVVVAANQAGNAYYAAAAQVTQNVVVNQASQTISFTAPSSPVTYGVSPISLSASASSGLAVTFSLVSGPGSISGNTLTISGVGAVVVAANQAGNANYAAAAQVTQSVFVNQASSSISVGSSSNPSMYSMLVTFTATLTSGATGNVTFYDGGTAIGAGVISGTTATFSTTALLAGSHSITASWAGNSDFIGATSSAIPQTVAKESVVIYSASSLSPSVYGDNVAWTFTLTGNGIIPTGTVTIKDGANTLATVPLNAGIATYNTSALVAGGHTLVAVYNGDNNYQ